MSELGRYILKVSQRQLPAYKRGFGLKTNMSQRRSFIAQDVLELLQPCLSSLSECFSKNSHARWINCNIYVFGGGKKHNKKNVELAPSNGSTWSHWGNNNNLSKRLFEGWMLKVLCSCLNFLSFTIRDSLHTKLRCDNIAGITAIKSDYETLPCCPRNKCSSSVLHKKILFVFFYCFFQWKSVGTILHWRIMICKCSTLV